MSTQPPAKASTTRTGIPIDAISTVWWLTGDRLFIPVIEVRRVQAETRTSSTLTIWATITPR